MGGPPLIPPGGGGAPPIGGPPPPPPPPPHGIGGGGPLPPLPNAGDVERDVKPNPSLSQKIIGFLFTHKISILSAGAMCLGAGIVLAATATGGGIGIIVVGSLIFAMSAFFFVMAPWMNILIDDIMSRFGGTGMPDIPQSITDLAGGASNMISHFFGALDSVGEKVKDWAGNRGPILP